MSDVERDDIREMRQQGDLKAFMRQQIRDGNARRASPPAVKPPPPPGYKPGAWPAGTRPPDPPPAEWSAEWDAALTAYREYVVATEHRDRLREDPGQLCHCKPCTDLRRIQ
ncbi:hypothetical protein [Streptomyces sp. NPDC059994]|uniref:hypothetical protein n=1 Tax=Streptomyces sp. NPDC059994 TaxID=3347029 RepID=UPI0036A86EEB